MSEQPEQSQEQTPAEGEHVGPILGGTPEMEQYVADHPEHVDPGEPTLDTDQHDSADPAHAEPGEQDAEPRSDADAENREAQHGA